MMKFKIGQTVKLIDNEGMGVPLGTQAIILKIYEEFLDVKWQIGAGTPTPNKGGWLICRWESVVNIGEQLLFDFMKE